MTNMHNPPHPGEFLRDEILSATGLSVSEAARQLGVSRVTLSRVLNEKAGIGIDLAMRLEAWLSGRPNAAMWLRLQLAYDLWQAEHTRPRPVVAQKAVLAETRAG